MKKITICCALLSISTNITAQAPKAQAHDFRYPIGTGAEQQKDSAPLEVKHSKIGLQKITNQSSQPVFIAFERAHFMPFGEPFDFSGTVMSDKDYQITDPEGEVHAAMIPVWQKTFLGNTINVVTLSGQPGIIWYLYVINDSLWAIKAPNKEGELKGVHLLDPSQENRIIELIIKDRNVLEAKVLETKKGT